MSSASSIGPGTAVRGNVRGDGDLEIFGRVEGSVAVTGDLTIGDGALIQSDISGRRVTVRGAVAGNVSGDEAIVLEPGARVVGDLGAPTIGIQAGALVRGNVTTGAPLGVSAPARAPAAAAAPRPAAAPRAAAPQVARPAPAPARPAPAARPAPVRPPPEPRHAPPPEPRHAPPPEPRHAPPPEPRHAAPAHEEPEPEAEERQEPAAAGPPPPVVPALRKGAKASLRKKGGK